MREKSAGLYILIVCINRIANVLHSLEILNKETTSHFFINLNYRQNYFELAF